MKNKKVTYLLILMVILVWFGVLYRIKGYVADNSKIENENLFSGIGDSIKVETDTYKLILNYRDPFLNCPSEVKNSHISIETKKIINYTNEQEIEPKVWPIILYKGMIQNKNSGKMVVILNIDKIDFLFLPGEIQNNVKVEFAYKDSVVVSYLKNKKIFYKLDSK